MKEIVLSEKLRAQEAIENSSFGGDPKHVLMYVAKYYCSLGYNCKDMRRLLEDFVLRCEPSTNVFRWNSAISWCVANADKYPLIDIDGVKVTSKEIGEVKKAGGVLLQRLLFTLICLAKYGNAVNPNNKNWVNTPPRDIFSLADIKVNLNRQSLMINDLWKKGCLEYSRIVDNINLNVKVIDEDPKDEALFVTDFRSLGNQYMKFIGNDYMECQNCGIVVKRTSNRQKYCPSCAAKIQITTSERSNGLTA